MQVIRQTSISASAILLTVPAVAHHSTSMYDLGKTVTLNGTIKAFHWTNPHCSIDLLVPSANGQQEWSIQLGPPTKLYREDWKPLMFKPGDLMTASVHPMRNGTHRGLLISRTSSDGKPK